MECYVVGKNEKRIEKLIESEVGIRVSDVQFDSKPKNINFTMHGTISLKQLTKLQEVLGAEEIECEAVTEGGYSMGDYSVLALVATKCRLWVKPDIQDVNLNFHYAALKEIL